MPALLFIWPGGAPAEWERPPTLSARWRGMLNRALLSGAARERSAAAPLRGSKLNHSSGPARTRSDPGSRQRAVAAKLARARASEEQQPDRDRHAEDCHDQPDHRPGAGLVPLDRGA